MQPKILSWNGRWRSTVYHGARVEGAGGGGMAKGTIRISQMGRPVFLGSIHSITERTAEDTQVRNSIQNI